MSEFDLDERICLFAGCSETLAIARSAIKHINGLAIVLWLVEGCGPGSKTTRILCMVVLVVMLSIFTC